MYKQFLCHKGKHEDQSIAFLPLYHSEGFEDPLESMEDFRKILQTHVMSKLGPKPCCKKNGGDSGAKFCKTCGRSLPSLKEDEIDGAVANLFLEIFDMTIDKATSIKLLSLMESEGWELGVFHPRISPVIFSNVDRWLDEGGSGYISWTFEGKQFDGS